MKFSFRNNAGAIGILTTLVLGIVLVMITVTVVLSGISSRFNAFVLSQSDHVLISTEGCAEDALIQLSRNSAFPGGATAVDGTLCSVSVAGVGDFRDVTVSGSQFGITRTLSIRAQIVPPFHITRWEG